MIFKRRSFSQGKEKIEQQFPFRIDCEKIAFLSRSSMSSFIHDKIPSETVPLFIRLISFRTVNGRRTDRERVQFGTQTHSMLDPS